MNDSKLIYFFTGAAAVLLYISNRLWPTQGAQLLDIFYSLVLLGGVAMLLFYGTLRRSKYRTPVMLGAATVVTGLIFGLQELNGADVITIAGGATMLIFYSIHFFSKASRKLLDYMKLIWLAATLTGLVFVLSGLPHAIIITDAVNLLLLVILIIFLAGRTAKPFTPRNDQQ